MDKKKEKSKTDRLGWIAVASIVLICLSAIAYVTEMRHHFTNWEEAGQFGDSFGALNTIFSGLAFALLIISILIQQKELALQREEMQSMRKEHEVSRLINILYKQIERVDFSIANLTVKPFAGSNVYNGLDAVKVIMHYSQIYRRQLDNANNLDRIERSDNLIRWINSIDSGKMNFFNFIGSIYSASMVVYKQLMTHKLNEEEKAELKELFLANSFSPELTEMFREMATILKMLSVELEHVAIQEYTMLTLREISEREEKILFLRDFSLLTFNELRKR